MMYPIREMQVTMSCCGIPSVMQTTKSSSASIASMIAAAANGGGTYITEALALVSAFASATVLKTGRPKCSVPPFFGVTPPTYIRINFEKMLLSLGKPSKSQESRNILREHVHKNWMEEIKPTEKGLCW